MRTFSRVGSVTIFAAVAGCAVPRPPSSAELQRITQAMADAVAPGERAVWERYTDPALIYVSEDAEVKDKTVLMRELEPLPAGSSGHIEITELRTHASGDVVVATYVMEETESVEGQLLHARYRETDTWHPDQHGRWLLVGAEVLAIPHDPPAVALTAAQLDEYAGRYARSDTAQVELRRVDDHLVRARLGKTTAPLVWRSEARDLFFEPGHPRTRQLFQRGADGAITGFVERREGEDLLWRKITSP